MKKVTNILWGIVFITIGIILTLNTFEITNIELFFDGWWTLLIIIPATIDFITKQQKTSSLIGIIIGILLLLSAQDLINVDLLIKLIIPISIIMIGLYFIFKDCVNTKIKDEIKKLNHEEKNEYNAIFASETIDSIEESNNLEINAIFGDLTLNLNNVDIKDNMLIEANAIFGQTTIITKSNVNVKVISSSIFGKVNNSINNNEKTEKTIYVKANAVFGGVRIK